MTSMNDSQKLRLVRHLFERVKGELTGCTVSEILDNGPRDRLHAGVLLPFEPELPTTGEEPSGNALSNFSTDEGGPGENPRALKVDSDSVMSMDFQVHVPEGVDRFSLRITPHMSVYYAVFPTYPEVRHNQRMEPEDEGANEADDLAAPTVTDPDGDPEDQETDPDPDLVASHGIAYQIAAEVTQTVAEEAPTEPDTIVLPLKFRKTWFKWT